MSKYMDIVNFYLKIIPRMLKEGNLLLPTEAQAAKEHHVSRQTIRTAYTYLAQAGLVEGRQGSGTYLTGLLPEASQNSVALLVSTDMEYIYPELIRDIGRELGGRGFSFRVSVTGGSIPKERSLLEAMLEKPPRGLIAECCEGTLPSPNLDLYARLRQLGTSVVFLFGKYPNDPSALCVKDDNFRGAYDLTSYLVQQNHRRIGGIFRADTCQGHERYYGYVSALRDFGCELPDRSVLWFDRSDLYLMQKKQDTGFLRTFIREQLMSCTAAVCYNDEIALSLMRELRSMDIRVPEDISIAGFDNSYLRHADEIRLTTMAHRPHEMGNTVSRILLDAMSGRPVSSVEIPWTRVPGTSTRAL